MTLGEKIEHIRIEQNISQKELAKQIGVTTGCIAEWESNEVTPTIYDISNISKCLGVSTDYFLLDNNEEIIIEITNLEVSQTKENPVHRPRKTKRLLISIIVLLLVIIAIIMGIKVYQANLPFSKDTEAMSNAAASVVKIICYDNEGIESATGSGFIAYDSKTIVTNYHVMENAYSCDILTEQDIPYTVDSILCYSKEYDIAILSLAESTELIPLVFGKSNEVAKGESIVAIGSPLGIKNTISQGNLSGIISEINMDILQFTAPISSGSSGGALFNENGEVIGVTYASFEEGQNLNLAIPIELVEELYINKNEAVEVSAIFNAKYPYLDVLPLYEHAQEVTLDELKYNPDKFYGKEIKVFVYVSSIGNQEMYVSSEDYISGSIYSDRSTVEGYNFEETPYIEILGPPKFSYPYETYEAGEYVMIIGEFFYSTPDDLYYKLRPEKKPSVTTGRISVDFICEIER